VSWVAAVRDEFRWAGKILCAGVGLGAGSCSPLPGFGCDDDAQCRHAEVQGHCEPVGFCAYPDSGCPSGSRFSRYAGAPYTNECAPKQPEESTTSGDTDDESSGSTGEPDPDPVCGNGIIEDGEECDDGEPSVACNGCCRLSGAKLGEVHPATDLRTNEGYDLVMLGDGDIVIAGRHLVTDQSQDPPVSHGRDALVMRISPSGEQVWLRSFHGPPHEPEDGVPNRNDEAHSVQLDATGGKLLVAGFLTPETAEDGPTARPVMWLTELDAETGEVIWEHLDGEAGPDSDQGRDATYDPAGGIVVAGQVGFGPVGFAVRRYELEDDATLTRPWEQVIVDQPPVEDPPITPGNSLAHAILTVGDLVFAAGTVSVDGVSGHHLQPFDLMTGELTPRQSCADAGVGSTDAILDLAVAPDGHIAVAGYRTTAPNDQDAWVALYGPGGCDPHGQGTPVWQRIEPGAAGKHDEARGIVVDSQGDLIVAGFLDGGNSNRDIWVAKYRHMAEIDWSRTYNGPNNGNDQGWSVVLDEDICEVAVVGHVQSSEGRNDIWVGRLTQ
jgi:hypothetical protein